MICDLPSPSPYVMMITALFTSAFSSAIFSRIPWYVLVVGSPSVRNKIAFSKQINIGNKVHNGSLSVGNCSPSVPFPGKLLTMGPFPWEVVHNGSFSLGNCSQWVPFPGKLFVFHSLPFPGKCRKCNNLVQKLIVLYLIFNGNNYQFIGFYSFAIFVQVTLKK